MHGCLTHYTICLGSVPWGCGYQSTRRLGPKYNAARIQEGLESMYVLLPGFAPSLDYLKASDWVGKPGTSCWGMLHAAMHWTLIAQTRAAPIASHSPKVQ